MRSVRKAKKKAAEARVPAGALLVSVEDARALLRKEWADITPEDRLLVLNANPDAKTVAVARQPNYFDDLVPSNNGYRVKGLWKRSVDAVVDSDRPEPPAQRDAYAVPAGLSNLGNTCYVNSALQVLFTNRVFRNAVLRLEDGVVEGDAKGILRELRQLFIALQFGSNSVADPTRFVEVLKLQASEQQDAQEFQKLLMQALEHSMGRSGDAEVRHVLNQLYCGASSYVTRCRRCQRESRHSSNVSDYFELDLQVKGVKTLDASLQTLVAPDPLTGSNQYHCDFCAAKTDADRMFCIRRVPPCLRVNLSRFIFDIASNAKQKCKDAISFPMTLDLTAFVHPVAAPSDEPMTATPVPDGPCGHGGERLEYVLTAILLHRGTSASSGHYVSIVKDEQTERWWKYDDGAVTDMGSHPFKGAKWDAGSGEEPGGEKAPQRKAAAATAARKRGSGGAAKPTAKKAKTNGAADTDDDLMVVDGGAAAAARPTARQRAARRKASPDGGGEAAALAPAPAPPPATQPPAAAPTAEPAPAEVPPAVSLPAMSPPQAPPPTSPSTVVATAASRKRTAPGRAKAAGDETAEDGEKRAAEVREEVRQRLAASAAGKPLPPIDISGSPARARPPPRAAPPPVFLPPVTATLPPVTIPLPSAMPPLPTFTDVENVPPVGAAPPVDTKAPASGAPPQELSSKDAYMLIYTRKGCRYGSCVPSKGDEDALPAPVRDVLKAMAETQQAADRAEAERRAAAKAEVMERRELVRSIAAHLPVAGAGEECRLVASDWLTTWANAPPTEAVPAIDNSELVCQHGRLDAAAWSSAKRVSLVGWTELHARHGGGPEVGPNDLCEECTRQALVEIVAKEDTDTARKGILDAVKVALKGDAADEAGAMLISRSWLRSWHTKQCRLVFLTDGAVSPTHAIVCRHGRLLPETHMKGRPTNRIAVQRHVFDFVREHWRPSSRHSAPGSSPPAAQSSGCIDITDASPSTSRTITADGGAAGFAVHGGAAPERDVTELCMATDGAPAGARGAELIGAGSSKGQSAAAQASGDVDADRAAAGGAAAQDEAEWCMVEPLSPRAATEAAVLAEIYNGGAAAPELAADAAAAAAPRSAAGEDVVMVSPVDAPADDGNPKDGKTGPVQNEFVRSVAPRAPDRPTSHCCSSRDQIPTVQARRVMEFPAADADACECAECAVLMGACAEKEGAYKSAILAERVACRELLGTTTLLYLHPGERYALVPRAWLALWRRWIGSSPWKDQGGLRAARAGAAGGGAAAAGEAPPRGVVGLTEALREHTVVVDGELRMLQHLPALRPHRADSRWSQADPAGDEMMIVSWEDWQALKEYHGDADTPDLAVTFLLEDAPPAADDAAAAQQAAGSGELGADQQARGDKDAAAAAQPAPSAGAIDIEDDAAAATARAGSRGSSPVDMTGDDAPSTSREATPATSSATAASGRTAPARQAGQKPSSGKAKAVKASVARPPTERQLKRQMQAEEAAAAAAAADGAADGEGEGDEEVTGAQPKTRKVGRLVSELPVCTDTIARRAAEKRRHMLVYTDAEVSCQVVTLEQAQAGGGELAAAKRSRRGRSVVRVSHTDTLADLKVRLYEGLKVHPLNMQCFVRGRPVSGDGETLQALDIAADDFVNIVKCGDADDLDVGSVIAYKEAVCSESMSAVAVAARAERGVGKERGFAHTALVGSTVLPPAAGGAAGSNAPQMVE